MQNICFVGNNITDEAADEIAITLHKNTKLQELDISNLYFHTASIMKILKGLQKIVTLKKLNFGSFITDKTANGIATVLYHNTQLREFSIRLTPLSQNSITSFTRALCATANLRVIKIESIGASIPA